MPWVLGLGVAVLWLGPALAPGGLYSLDLILPHDVPVPRGVWGLGPELPRRVPFMVPAAWLSPLVGGDTVGKAMLVGTIVIGFVGAYRLVADRSRLAAAGAGLVLALSPFLLTRLAAGHVMIATTMALLPWAYPRLLRPSDRLDRTFLWCLALACTGNYGGMVALIVLAAGLVHTRFRRGGAVLGLWLVAQLPWLVPGIVVYAQGANLAGAIGFATVADGPGDVIGVLAGHGFWNGYYQVGWTTSWVVAPLAIVLLGLAVVGHRDLPTAWRGPAAVLAVIGAVVATSTAVPGMSWVVERLTENPIGSNLRESQRLLPLYLVWMAPAAGLGAARLRRRALDASPPRPALATLVSGLPAAVALVLAGPGLWGLGVHLESVTMPPDWEAARERVAAEPGTTVAFPWSGYTNVRLGVVRHVLNPWPIYLGGDVLVSSDLRASDEPSAERADPREPVVRQLADEVQQGQPVGDRLAELGVRWVVFNRVGDYRPYNHLDDDPGLERVLAGNDVFLYRVRAWRGHAVDDAGRPVGLSTVVEPLATVDGTEPVVWARPAARGWLRGWTPGEATPEGTLRFPAGGSVVWYWPSVVVLVADAVTCAFVVWAVRTGRRHRRGAPSGASTGATTETAAITSTVPPAGVQGTPKG
ncbi:MAG: hypothetical protein U0Q07_03015 [Acidimicrobiales bacterium]